MNTTEKIGILLMVAGPTPDGAMAPMVAYLPF